MSLFEVDGHCVDILDVSHLRTCAQAVCNQENAHPEPRSLQIPRAQQGLVNSSAMAKQLASCVATEASGL